jgi:CheY-like chemotaxis protein
MPKMAKPCRRDKEVLMRIDTLIKNRTLSDVGDTDAYNQLQVQRIAHTRQNPTTTLPSDVVRRRLRVLIVDDHHASTDTLAMLMKAWGHNIRRAYDGAAGLELAAEYLPDIMLLDMMMPKMNGRQLALQVRQQASLQNCLLVAITGCTDECERLHALEAGVDLFLVKPVAPCELQSLLVAESKRLTRSRRGVAALALATTTTKQWAGARSVSPTRLGRNIAPAVVAI